MANSDWTLQETMEALYDSEINCSISCMWDGGWDVKLGDHMNGFKDTTTVESLTEAASWLRTKAVEHYPRSLFATGAHPHNCTTHFDGNNVFGDCWSKGHALPASFRVQSVDIDAIVCTRCVGFYRQSKHWRVSENPTPAAAASE